MKIVKIFAVAVATALMAGTVNCTAAKTDPATQDVALDESKDVPNVLLPVDDNQFRPGMKVSEPTLIDFNATWCGPCQMLTPAFDLAAASYAGKVKFYSIDVDKYQNTAKAFQVSSIPYLLLVLPNGTVKQILGIGDLLTGLDMNSNPSRDDITNTMFKNLSALLDEAIAK